MELSVNIARFGGPRPLAVVIGHERSGNHFLMNAIAACCGYTVTPYLDLDHADVNINFHHAEMLENVLTALAGQHTASVVKSHHHHDFFADVLGQLNDQVQIFYIFRHPVPVLESFWKFVQSWPWREGPPAADVLSFAKAPPAGRLLRYQMDQTETMLKRWESHVTGWLHAASAFEAIHPVCYENLRDDYAQVMTDVCATLACPVQDFPRPGRDDYIKAAGEPGPAVTETERAVLREWVCGELSAETLNMPELRGLFAE